MAEAISTSTGTLARTASAGALFFAFVMYLVFPLVQPELDPLYRFGSEYAGGRMGWLMKLAFFVWGTGIVSLGMAFARGLDNAARSPTAIAFFMIAGLGVFFAGVFDSDLQIRNENPPPMWIEPAPSAEQVRHAAASMIGLLSLMLAAGLETRRLRLAGRLRSGYRMLRWLTWLCPMAFIVFATVSVDYGLPGLGQRLFLLLLFGWLVIAARGLSTGAFSARAMA